VPEEVRNLLIADALQRKAVLDSNVHSMSNKLHTLLLQQGGVGCILQVHASSKTAPQEQTVISLQARSRRETNLWGEILQVVNVLCSMPTTLRYSTYM
jgi:hypothetical protein